MKLTFILILAACLQVSAKAVSQTVTFKGKDVPLQKIFSMIKKQTGYAVMYNADQLEKARPVTIDVTNVPLEGFLQQVLHDQPFGFSIENTTIFISTTPFADRQEAPRKAADIPPVGIKGMVTSDNGPVAGANVVIKRTGKGTTTAANGQFSLPEVNEDDILVISSIGFQRQEVPVKGTKGYVFVQLKIAVDKLDEIQVLAYGGATTRRLSTGSVSKVTSEEISRNPVGNVLLALAGRVTGLSISQFSGLTGGMCFSRCVVRILSMPITIPARHW